MGVLVGCVCALFAIFIGLMLMSVIIRAAVWITNKCLGESGSNRYRRRDYDYDDEWDDYDRPVRRRGAAAIPEPDLFKGMGIAFLVWVCQIVVSVVFTFLLVGAAGGAGGGGFGGGGGGGGFGGGRNPLAPPPGVNPALQLGSSCIQLVIGFLIWSGLLSLMLPTSFGRASLVTVFIYLILIAIGIIIFGVLLVAGIGMAGLQR